MAHSAALEAQYSIPGDGTILRSGRDAVELIGNAADYGADVIVIPATRCGDEFFQLRTRVAGEILQKFVTYQARVVILGDISRQIQDSSALHDFVYESNQGRSIWFVADLAELAERLARA